MVLIPILSFIGIGLLAVGVAYALLIYIRPFPPGWTWVSVLVGVIFTTTGESAAILVVLSVFDLLHIWWLVLFPYVAFLLTGLPMAIGQEIKRWQQNKRNGEVLKEIE